MNECRAASNRERLHQIELIIVVLEEQLEVFIGKEVTSMRGYAAKCHHMRALPKSEQPLLGIQRLNDTF